MRRVALSVALSGCSSPAPTPDIGAIGFTVQGDRAFERYTYKSTDTDRKTGGVTQDRGKGVDIFRRGSDGKWRVAVDSWSSDRPVG